MKDTVHQEALQISSGREKEIWEHFIGLYIDRFVREDHTIDSDALRKCLETKLGPLFVEHADQFEAILQSLNGTVDATRS